jgi:hypothetical protein
MSNKTKRSRRQKRTEETPIEKKKEEPVNVVKESTIPEVEEQTIQPQIEEPKPKVESMAVMSDYDEKVEDFKRQEPQLEIEKTIQTEAHKEFMAEIKSQSNWMHRMLNKLSFWRKEEMKF